MIEEPNLLWQFQQQVVPKKVTRPCSTNQRWSRAGLHPLRMLKVLIVWFSMRTHLEAPGSCCSQAVPLSKLALPHTNLDPWEKEKHTNP